MRIMQEDKERVRGRRQERKENSRYLCKPPVSEGERESGTTRKLTFRNLSVEDTHRDLGERGEVHVKDAIAEVVGELVLATLHRAGRNDLNIVQRLCLARQHNTSQQAGLAQAVARAHM